MGETTASEDIRFFHEEVTPELLSEIEPLLRLHWEEIAHYKDIPLQPDWDAYLNLASHKALRVFTVRKSDRLIGYSVFFVRKNLHYSSSLQAVQDILFLLPEHRGAFLGYRFIAWCDEQLKAEGVQAVYHHVKAAHDFGPMLERLGYELVDRIYGRRLD